MNRYAIVRQIQDLAATVPVGEDHRHVCPACSGGKTREASLSVRRSSDIEASFICYRASCDLGGGKVALLQEGGQVLAAKSRPVSKNRRHPDRFPLSDKAVALLKDKYGLTELLIRYSGAGLTYDGRVVLPVRGPNRLITGLNVCKERELYTGTREFATIPKKWLFVSNEDSYCAAWYRCNMHKRKASDTLVIVEDMYSAIRLVPYCDSVALIGTNMLRPVLQDIRNEGYDRVWLALDNDAIKKAFWMQRRLQAALPNLSIMALPRDIKDMGEEQLTNLLTDYKVINANTFQEQREEGGT